MMIAFNPLKTFVFSLLLCTLSSVHSQEEIKIKSVELKVKSGPSWSPTPGRLFKLTEGIRKYAADIDKNGQLDVEVKCKAGERFEADAESPLDRPSPPPRVICGDTLTFKYVRAVYASFAGSILASSGIEPKLYSELAVRTARTGSWDASNAFNDAAISSTAQLLGDTKLDQYVARDPLQDFKLVLNPAGIEALKQRQRQAGIKESGAIDSATQNEFASAIFGDRSDASLSTPSFTCGKALGVLNCSTSAAEVQGPPTMTVPQFKIEKSKASTD